jgi:N-acetylglucosaminyldiphosphoundecaprenol N-acetyl-beta-D-mannosaminyltransferase
VLLRLLVLRVLPLAAINVIRLIALGAGDAREVEIGLESSGDFVRLSISGAATTRSIVYLSHAFRLTLQTGKEIRINLSKVSFVDSRFLGLLLMLRKKAAENRQSVVLTDLPLSLRNLFRLNGLGFLLSSGARPHGLSSMKEAIRLVFHPLHGPRAAKL